MLARQKGDKRAAGDNKGTGQAEVIISQGPENPVSNLDFTGYHYRFKGFPGGDSG